jgi:hypothetical protein
MLHSSLYKANPHHHWLNLLIQTQIQHEKAFIDIIINFTFRLTISF